MLRMIKEYYIIRKSGLFDKDYYLSENHDVKKSGIDPLRHFVRHGSSEKRNPCEFFDIEYYLMKNPDVDKSNVNPFYHFVKIGWREGRRTHKITPIIYSDKISKSKKIILILSKPFTNTNLLKKTIKSFKEVGFSRTIKNIYLYSLNVRNDSISLRQVISEKEHESDKLMCSFIELNNNPFSDIDLNMYDYYFFDIFDTVLIRYFYRPTDVFEFMSFINRNKEFSEGRIKQEISARKRKFNQKDINLSDIYLGFKDDYDLNEEIDAEHKICISNPQVHKFYLKLVEERKKIFFISDMYFSKEIISSLLEKNGFSIYEDIFVSSEDDLIKGDGSRYKWLKESYPETVGRSIMIGDNVVSDFEQPKAHGYDSFHYMPNEDFFKKDPFIKSKIHHINANKSLGLSCVVSMFRYWKLTFQDDQPLYWRQFGFLYGGALIYCFCQYVHSYVVKNRPSCSKIYFMGRDGDIMKKVYNILFDKLQVDSSNILASRRSIVFPALTDLNLSGDSGQLLHFTRPQGVEGPETILERIGYSDLCGLAQDLNGFEKKISKLSANDIYNCLKRNKEAILEKVESERKVLYEYLKNNGLFEQKDLIIVDVGWGGSIQNALQKLLKIWKHDDINLTGLYFGVNTNPTNEKSMTGYLYNNNFLDQEKYKRYIELMELICSSPMDPIERFEYNDKDIVPVSNGVSLSEMKRQIISSSIQEGITDFAHLAKNMDFDLDFIDRSDLFRLLSSIDECPSVADLRHLYQLKHSAGIGDKYDTPVIDFPFNKDEIITSNIKVVSVFVNEKMYNKFFTDNYQINCYELIGIDNRKSNYGLPSIYNGIIDEFIDEDFWLLFCHEDFFIKEDLRVLDMLDRNRIFGTCGVKNNINNIPIGYGKHTCSNKDGTCPTEIGLEISNVEKVQTLDCQSILIHTSLMRKFPSLRFDENLTFDLYVEDLCISASHNFNIDINVFPLKFQHFSYGNITERYFEALSYLASKYPEVSVPGSCSFIGGNSQSLEKFFKYDVLPCYK